MIKVLLAKHRSGKNVVDFRRVVLVKHLRACVPLHNVQRQRVVSLQQLDSVVMHPLPVANPRYQLFEWKLGIPVFA